MTRIFKTEVRSTGFSRNGAQFGQFCQFCQFCLKAVLQTTPSQKNTPHQARASQPRSGYTLMELLLALGLSVVVIAAIGIAIQIYMISLTNQQAMIERKQIVRSIFAMIGNDLRAGVQYKASDYSGLDTLLQTQITNMASQIPLGEEEEEAAPEVPMILVEEEVAFRPTLLGSQTAVMIDISRLPRLDQYNPLVAAADLETQTPSDVKSLAYFVSLDKGGIEDQLDFAETRAPGGLYRREIDRAVADYMGNYDLMSEADKYTRLVAHEVAQIAFRYFDGEEWQTEWDSAEAGGFPSAIEIMLVIDTERSAESSQSYSYGGPDEETAETYRYVVHLPVADLPKSEE